MAKICALDGCNNPVFGGGYCKYHQKWRTDKKPKELRKVSDKGKSRKEDKKKLVEEDKKFYLEIWESREHYCFETGAYLGEEPLMTMFHHVLEKSKYPQYRHCEWNIVLLLAEVHNQVHSNIDKCPKVKHLTQLLKDRHERRVD